MFRTLLVLLTACSAALDDGTPDDVAEDTAGVDGSHVPCAPVTIATSSHHALSLQQGLTATIVAPKPGGYYWELADRNLGCQARIASGQGTSSITFDAGFAGCLVTLGVTDAQNCTGSARVQVDFTDVTTFHDFIDNVAGNDVIRGCGGGKFCPGDSTLRQEMMRVLLRARRVTEGRPDYEPPACVPTATRKFADVPFTNPYCPWIEQAFQEQITSGCGGNNFCPASPVTRGQAAVFLLAGFEGPSYVPPACVAGQPRMFDDVPASHVFCAWIEEFARRGITGGCGSRLYCPDAPVTRGQMAVFTKVTFGLVFP